MSQSQLAELIDRLKVSPPALVDAAVAEAHEMTKGRLWIPTLGPQADAYWCEADELLFGGEAGPGKTDLLLGLAFEGHQRSLLMRRQYTDMGALVERALQINGTRDGFNGSPPPKLRTVNGKLIEFGAASKLGDEEHWQGQPHDLLGIDEAVQFLESQVRFLMGWVRSVDENQRCRAILATNPPVTASGQWIIPMYRPWLDITHSRPAKPGELRYFISDKDGKDYEVDGPEPIERDGKTYIPISRTFIPGTLGDNPYLIRTGYQKRLDSLPEPLRSAVRDGNFMAAREDAADQVIPTAWVIEANRRWSPIVPPGIPMCAMGVDASGGGKDPMTIAPRYDSWFAPIIEVPGSDIPPDSAGKFTAAAIISHRRDLALIILDMGGGYGGPAYEHLKDNSVEVYGYKGAEAATGRTADRQLAFYNKRSQAYWQFREALDPDQEGGSPVALPEDPVLMSDLTSPTFEVTTRGIKIEEKTKVVARLGRSPDRADAVVMSWFRGDKRLMPGHYKHPRGGGRPKVITKRTMRGEAMRRRER
jgi:hypothetical protein